MNEDKVQKLRENLLHDLLKVVESHRTDIGISLTGSDVVGVLEWVKMGVYLESVGNDLLNETSLNVN